MPVGPEFQDPPSEVQQMPYFVPPPGGFKFPFYEQTVTLSGTPQVFEVIVNDPNKGDTLSVHWVANYPPNSPATVPFSIDTVDRGSDGSGMSMRTITCDMIMQGADHNLVAILSDSGFLDPSSGNAAFSNIPYNFNTAGGIIATMVGWRIAGCP